MSSKSDQIIMVVMGLLLLVPGGCSLLSTPLLVLSLVELDPFGGSRPLIGDMLYYWPLGVAIALGGYKLLKSSHDPDGSVAAPGWLLLSAGILLLMPAVSTIVSWAYGYLPKMLSATNPMLTIDILHVFVAPAAFVAGGVFLLRRGWDREW